MFSQRGDSQTRKNGVSRGSNLPQWATFPSCVITVVTKHQQPSLPRVCSSPHRHYASYLLLDYIITLFLIHTSMLPPQESTVTSPGHQLVSGGPGVKPQSVKVNVSAGPSAEHVVISPKKRGIRSCALFFLPAPSSPGLHLLQPSLWPWGGWWWLDQVSSFPFSCNVWCIPHAAVPWLGDSGVGLHHETMSPPRTGNLRTGFYGGLGLCKWQVSFWRGDPSCEGRSFL